MLLKKHPTEILGREINTDFLTWMGIGVIIDNPDMMLTEKMDSILVPLFGECPYDPQVALEWYAAVVLFYTCEAEDRGLTPPDEQLLDWEYDSDTIWADFKHWYGIDLDETRMHWWKFKALFNSLSPDSAIKGKMAIRGEDLNDYTGKGQEKLRRRKEEQKRAAAIRWTEEVD